MFLLSFYPILATPFYYHGVIEETISNLLLSGIGRLGAGHGRPARMSESHAGAS
jgi:hypothetical protein